MSPKLRTVVTVLVVVSGCSDREPTGLEPTSPATAPAASVQDSTPTQSPRDRKDTPWQRMNDQELITAVEEADGRVMVGFKDSVATEGVDNRGRVVASASAVEEGKVALRNLGAEIQREFEVTPLVVARIDPGRVPALRADPRVDYVEPVATGTWETVSAVSAPLTPRASFASIAEQIPTNLSVVEAPAAWDFSTGEGTRLLIMDSGVDHPDLLPSIGFKCSGSTTADEVGHGTHVAGIAAALENDEFVRGVAHDALLMNANVADTTTGAPVTDEIVCSLEWARLNDAAVVNMSLSVPPSTAITDQIRAGHDQDDIVYVAAAGNTNGGSVRYPATLDETIAVGATNNADLLASFSAVGPEVDLVAPGVDVLSTALPSGIGCASGGLLASCSGTSRSAPHVSGAAALLRARYPSWTNHKVEHRLFETAVDLGPLGKDDSFGQGRLDILAAVKMSVTVLGPLEVEEGSLETWFGAVTGGIAPHTVEWFVDGALEGTGSDFSFAATEAMADEGSFELVFRATSSEDEVASFQLTVSVTPADGGEGEPN